MKGPLRRPRSRGVAVDKSADNHDALAPPELRYALVSGTIEKDETHAAHPSHVFATSHIAALAAAACCPAATGSTGGDGPARRARLFE